MWGLGDLVQAGENVYRIAGLYESGRISHAQYVGIIGSKYNESGFIYPVEDSDKVKWIAINPLSMDDTRDYLKAITE